MSRSSARKAKDVVVPVAQPKTGNSVRFEITEDGEAALAAEEARIRDIHDAETRLSVVRGTIEEIKKISDEMDVDIGAGCPTCAQSMDSDVRARLFVALMEHLDAARVDERYFVQRIEQLGGMVADSPDAPDDTGDDFDEHAALFGEIDDEDDELPF